MRPKKWFAAPEKAHFAAPKTLPPGRTVTLVSPLIKNIVNINDIYTVYFTLHIYLHILYSIYFYIINASYVKSKKASLQ